MLSWYLLKKYFFQYFFFYLLILLFFIPLLLGNIISLYENGLTFGSLLFSQACTFLAYILYLEFKPKENNLFENTSITISRFQSALTIILFTGGFICYCVIASGFIKLYPSFVQLVAQQENKAGISQSLTVYTDSAYAYSIAYPQFWSIYHYGPNAITLFNNYTFNTQGGVWVTITVTPLNQSVYTILYGSAPGLVAYDTTTTDVVTKVSNFILQGYAGVEYDYIKSESPYNQYNTHYLLNKNGTAYDIDFQVRSRVVQQENSVLFNEMIHSFKLTSAQDNPG
jgi:hypothetical protein